MPLSVNTSSQCSTPGPLQNPQFVGLTVLGSGSSGNCSVIHNGQEGIMLDAGFSAKETQARLLRTELSGIRIRAILVSHEHTDHIQGLRVCATRLNAPIFATAKCAMALRGKDKKLPRITTFAPGGAFSIGPFEILPFSVPHDADDPVAFTVTCHNVRIAVATDIGYPTASVKYALRQCHVLMLESNHDLNMLAASSRPWHTKQRIMGPQGHLNNLATDELLAESISDDTRNIVLAHVSRECNDANLAADLARKTLAALSRNDISLAVARQEAPLPTIWIDSQGK